MKKLLISLFLILLLGCTLVSCSESNDAPKELSGPWVLVDVLKDNGLVYQKIYYNTETEQTYIYNYYWKTSDVTGYDNIEKTTVTILDKDGNIIKE